MTRVQMRMINPSKLQREKLWQPRVTLVRDTLTTFFLTLIPIIARAQAVASTTSAAPAILPRTARSADTSSAEQSPHRAIVIDKERL
jgi:hypothetical protein